MTQQNVVVSDNESGINKASTAEVSIFPTTAQKPPAAPGGGGGYISMSRRRILKNVEINGGQRINAWVDSMRASSPTHSKATPSLAEEHSSWIVRTLSKNVSLIN